MSTLNPSPMSGHPNPQPGAGKESPTIDQDGMVAANISFWQHPFVQNILPFLTSLMMHVAIIVIGFVFFYTFKEVMNRTAKQQFQPSESSIMPGDITGTVPHPGLGGDPTRDAAQDKFPDVPPDSKGFSETPGNELDSLNAGGGSADAVSSGLIGVGGSGFGKGKNGVGNGEGEGTGNGKGNGGPLAPFGIPGGGGGMGVKFIGLTSNYAKQIVFVCDATGSMMSQFDNLRVELRKAVEGLKVPQAMNVVFFQENAAPPISKTLLLATPANKQRIYDFVDKYTPRGPTDPNPAIKIAFAMHPDLIFFLCDPSDFPDPKGTIELFKSLNADHKCHVNTISFMDENHEGEDMLKQISSDSGGKFKYVDENDMGK